MYVCVCVCVKIYYETKSFKHGSSEIQKEVHFLHISKRETDFLVGQEL